MTGPFYKTVTKKDFYKVAWGLIFLGYFVECEVNLGHALFLARKEA